MSFDFDFTVEDIEMALPGVRDPDGWFDAASAVLPKHGITKRQRVAMFLAQTGHESANWNVLTENLFYRAEGLMKVFPKYYPKNGVLANAHARKPELIANRVYANRMGNGDEKSGDGYRFRGRGILQITGRSNYTRCSNDLYGDDRLVKNPDLLLRRDIALETACWFWNRNTLNPLSDKGDVVGVTKIINGGTKGLEDRKARYNRIKKLI